ncbi:F0F1 ATP synthase subunit delta [Longirhabdus pacifica]|uniref:F0F1 ATP synthase subunit delta n=1 Tax=Longirhabdus pacifica TaxID=2305227 RepID=UPI001008FBDC|nr:F0F1 ATP synthase subunit delta [Longirhabdus pacifica]
MKNVIVAKRYAKALFEVAQSKKQVEEVGQQLAAIVDAFEQEEHISRFLLHPNVSNQDKSKVLAGSLGEASDVLKNTLLFMMERNRLDILPSLLEYYVRTANEALGREQATVFTPRELSAEEAKQITATFSKLTGKQITVNTKIDASLLGGIKVRIGDRLYDGSLAGKLTKLERTLAT